MHREAVSSRSRNRLSEHRLDLRSHGLRYLSPRFIQTAGPDCHNPANYRPIANGLVKTQRPTTSGHCPGSRQRPLHAADRNADSSEDGLLLARAVGESQTNDSRRWSYIGTSALPVFADSPVPFTYKKAGIDLPRWQVSDFMTGGSAGREPADSSLWREDLYYYRAKQVHRQARRQRGGDGRLHHGAGTASAARAGSAGPVFWAGCVPRERTRRATAGCARAFAQHDGPAGRRSGRVGAARLRRTRSREIEGRLHEIVPERPPDP